MPDRKSRFSDAPSVVPPVPKMNNYQAKMGDLGDQPLGLE